MNETEIQTYSILERKLSLQILKITYKLLHIKDVVDRLTFNKGQPQTATMSVT